MYTGRLAYVVKMRYPYSMEALIVKADGKKLRRLRKLALMTQEELTRASGVSRDTIIRIENGHDAHPSTIKKLAKALEVEGRELLSEDAE